MAASLSLMRRLPPHKVEQNLNGLLNLVPEETDELLQRVDQPLKEAVDAEMVGTHHTNIHFSLNSFHVICAFFTLGSSIFALRLQQRW
ncbi:hypothetical protein EON65_54350 [archaeon]|nr:MAG: hypothetical protein EON65_54350 [archaeon]